MQESLFETNNPEPVQTLKVKQPFAELIFNGAKQRIFTSAPIVLGRLAIYAPHFYQASIEDIYRHKPHFKSLVDRPLEQLDAGVLIGLVDVVRLVKVPHRHDQRPDCQMFWQELPDAELDRTDEIGPGQRCLWLDNPRRLNISRAYSLREDFCRSDPRIFEEIW